MMMLDERRFNRLAIAAVVAGFVLLALAFGAALVTQVLSERSSAQVDHTYRVVNRLGELNVLVERSAASSRGFLITPAPIRRRTFDESSRQVPIVLDEIEGMVSDNPRQIANIELLRPLVNEEMRRFRSQIEVAEGGDVEAGRALFRRQVSQHLLNRIRAITVTMRDEEERLLGERLDTQQAVTRWSEIVLLLTGLLLAALGLVTFLTVRSYTRGLTEARARLDELNAGLEQRVRERTSELQRANAEIQRFAYIVSHDLRSPLVNIMGFTAELDASTKQISAMVNKVAAEAPALVDEEARLAAEEDLPEAVSFIRTSTQKMDRLINAILRLSREGRRNLAPERLDMDSVVQTIGASLEQQLGDREARLIVENKLPAIVSDRVAVEQILSNLIENALKYGRPSGGTIRVGGSREGSLATFTVSDDGRGIDPKDHERIFDLFRRSGKQDQPGEGLGLAHVRALAYRLGGTVDVQSSLGEGATFRLIIPATYQEQEQAA